MARLPQPGGDAGNWGTVLNEYLSQAHKADGTLKPINGAVITNGTVTQAKLSASGSADAGKVLATDGSGLTWLAAPAATIADGSITTAKLANDAVTNVKLADNAVDTAQLADDAVTGTKLADSSVGTAQLTNDAVTSAKLADAAVGTTQLADGSINGAKLSVSNTPSNGQILSYNGGNFTWLNPPSGTGGTDPAMGGDLTGNASDAQIATGAVGAAELATGSVTTVKIADSNITTAKLATGAVDTAQLANDAVTNVKLADNAVDTAQLVDGAVTTAKLATGAVDTTQLANTSVTDAKIANNTITEGKLAVSNTPSSNQVLSWSGTAMAWTTPASGGGSGNMTVTNTKTANYTANSHEYVICDASGGGFTVTLPAASNGAWVTIKKIDSSTNAIIVDAPGGVLIDDNITVSVNNPWMAADVISDGTKWFRVG